MSDDDSHRWLWGLVCLAALGAAGCRRPEPPPGSSAATTCERPLGPPVPGRIPRGGWGCLCGSVKGVLFVPGASPYRPVLLSAWNAGSFVADLAVAGRRLALSAVYGGVPVLEIMEPDADLRLRPCSSQVALPPAWSPDGSALAYCEAGVLRLHRAGTSHLLLRSGDTTSLAWSPDGREIAYGRCNEQQQDEGLWVVATAGGAPRCLRRGSGRVGGPGSIRWSPDGRWLAFAERRAGREALALVRRDGRGYRPAPGWLAGVPVWRPGSDTVVYHDEDDRGVSRGLCSLSTRGRQERLLSGGREADYQVLPEGLIAAAEGHGDYTEVRLLRLERGRPRVLSRQCLPGGRARVCLSGDGRALAVVQRGEGTAGTLWLAVDRRRLRNTGVRVFEALAWLMPRRSR